MSELDDKLAQMLGSSSNPNPSTQQTGRGASGRLRNFAAMRDEKVLVTYHTVKAENNDIEAINALRAELDSRGLSS